MKNPVEGVTSRRIEGLETALHEDGIMKAPWQRGIKRTGDFFHYYKAEDGSHVIIVGDHEGKGVSVKKGRINTAYWRAGRVRNLIRTFLRTGRSIPKVFSLTNLALAAPQDLFHIREETARKKAKAENKPNPKPKSFEPTQAVASAMHYDPETKKITMTYAGGEQLVHFKFNPETREIEHTVVKDEKGGFPLGMFSENPRTDEPMEYKREEPISLEDGVYLLFTDGVDYKLRKKVSKKEEPRRLSRGEFYGVVKSVLKDAHDERGNRTASLKDVLANVRERLDDLGRRTDDLTLFAFAKRRSR
ncbi:MAG: SpoIIE family protein phosphatase [Candidatus Micrarchaeota archaeon]